MSSTVITCQNDTYLNSSSASTNFASAGLLKTKPWDTASPIYIPIFQFVIPQGIQYKKISSVKMQYRIYQYDYRASITGAEYRGFSANSIVDTVITYANQYTYGTYTEPHSVDFRFTLAGPDTSYQLSSYATAVSDITPLFVNNVINGIFSVAVNLNGANLYTTIHGNSMSLPAQLTIEYEDVLPGDPILIYPVEAYVNQDQQVKFKWAHNTESGAYQNGYELQWKKSTDESWTTLTSGTGLTNSYTAPAGTFPTGVMNWRCRTTDILSQVSNYSTSSFVVKGKPLAPVISDVKNDALTEIKWSASEQVAYESELYKDGVMILSNSRSTEENSYKPLIFLADGRYEFRIRIMNSYNIWSDWTSKVFTISTTKPIKPDIAVSVNGHVARIVLDAPGYIYRVEDGKEKLIAISAEGTYEDYELNCNKRTGYFVRVYDVGYTDSNTVYVTTQFDGFIVTNGTDTVQITESTETFIPFYEESSKESELIYYSGREYPVIESGEFLQRVIKRTCSIDEDQYNKLLKVYHSNDNIIYKDNRGCRMNCHMSKPNRTNSFALGKYTTELTFTQIDRKDVSINEES